jgi:hypothetical protein
LLPEAVKGIGAFVAELAPKIPMLFFKLIAAMVDIGGRLGGDLITALVDALKGLGSFGLDVGKSFANAIIRFINNNVIKKINDLVDFTIPLPFGRSLRVNPPDIGDIPELAEGGIVNSATLAVIGEKGPEAVIPLSKMGGMGGGMTITVNAGLVSTPDQIGQQIIEAILRLNVVAVRCLLQHDAPRCRCWSVFRPQQDSVCRSCKDAFYGVLDTQAWH